MVKGTGRHEQGCQNEYGQKIVRLCVCSSLINNVCVLSSIKYDMTQIKKDILR
jgi:hypothetical protein